MGSCQSAGPCGMHLLERMFKVKSKANTKKDSVSKGTIGRFTAVMIVMVVLLAWGLVLNVNAGSVKIPASEVFTMVWNGLKYKVADIFTGNYAEELKAVTEASSNSRIVFTIRIPRMLLAAILGGALAVSGFLLQTFFRNPIAGPFVLGISSGAKLVVGLVMIVFAEYIGPTNSLTLVIAAFAGSLLIVGLVLLLSQKVHNMALLLVAGIMVSYICSATTDFLITFASEASIVNLHNWSMGSFSAARWSSVGTAFLICLICFILAWMLSKPIGAYALGEGYALSLGINIKAFRIALILLSSLLSACVTAFAGPISFVGIAVPHITKTLLKTSKPILVIPAAYLCGSVFCMLCDLVARTAFSPREMAISTVTSFFGAPVVIYMMVKRRMAKAS